MRKAFEEQRRFGCRAIRDVKLNVKCRDEIIPILAALQHIFSQAELRDWILALVAAQSNRPPRRIHKRTSSRFAAAHGLKKRLSGLAIGPTDAHLRLQIVPARPIPQPFIRISGRALAKEWVRNKFPL